VKKEDRNFNGYKEPSEFRTPEANKHRPIVPHIKEESLNEQLINPSPAKLDVGSHKPEPKFN
jgi:hypothetical protein